MKKKMHMHAVFKVQKALIARLGYQIAKWH